MAGTDCHHGFLGPMLLNLKRTVRAVVVKEAGLPIVTAPFSLLPATTVVPLHLYTGASYEYFANSYPSLAVTVAATLGVVNQAKPSLARYYPRYLARSPGTVVSTSARERVSRWFPITFPILRTSIVFQFVDIAFDIAFDPTNPLVAQLPQHTLLATTP
ncbi:hypothetical protein CHU98_g5019 [Xylaria longipes]|nr:hypothetical protein CHU98_g5019 [Xylaria longipes]